MMPNMSGFEVVKRLQNHAETAAIPLLVVTGKQISAQERAALNGEAGSTLRVVEVSDFDNELFVAEVRRTFQAH
jgi:CheY-like chemotaxis protein